MIVGVITYLTTYKSTIIDPIGDIKKLYINTHLIIIAIFLAITFMVNLTSKKESILMKRLILIAIVTIITMFAFLIIKLNLDTTYNESTFEQFYIEKNTIEEINKKHKIDIGITGALIKTEKE